MKRMGSFAAVWTLLNPDEMSEILRCRKCELIRMHQDTLLYSDKVSEILHVAQEDRERR